MNRYRNFCRNACRDLLQSILRFNEEAPRSYGVQSSAHDNRKHNRNEEGVDEDEPTVRMKTSVDINHMGVSYGSSVALFPQFCTSACCSCHAHVVQCAYNSRIQSAGEGPRPLSSSRQLVLHGRRTPVSRRASKGRYTVTTNCLPCSRKVSFLMRALCSRPLNP